MIGNEQQPSGSPHAIYAEYCRRGQLAYQVRLDDGAAVFHPRLVAPGSGGDRLQWRVSTGLGRVYAKTVLARKGEPPYNIVLVDLDEGFRIMSRVEGIEPTTVEIGMRVEVSFHPAEDGEPPYPVFVPLAASGEG